jgi:hypothetical protein
MQIRKSPGWIYTYVHNSSQDLRLGLARPRRKSWLALYAHMHESRLDFCIYAYIQLGFMRRCFSQLIQLSVMHICTNPQLELNPQS